MIHLAKRKEFVNVSLAVSVSLSRTGLHGEPVVQLLTGERVLPRLTEHRTTDRAWMYLSVYRAIVIYHVA